MKKGLQKIFSALFIIIFAALLLALVTPPTVSAVLPTPTSAPAVDTSPANNSWEYTGEGSLVHPDQILLPAPNPWEILLSSGLTVASGGTQICHPFRGGQFGWTGAIYFMNGSSWVEIPSTTEWTPDEEGRIMICATAPIAGTYVIFGYSEPYERPVPETEEPPINDLPTELLSLNSDYTIE